MDTLKLSGKIKQIPLGAGHKAVEPPAGFGLSDTQIADILMAWTPEFCTAAQAEGWDLFTATDDSPVQLQRIDDPEECPGAHLPNDAAAMILVHTGTGAHHAAAREILQTHFPSEWAIVCKAEA